MVRYSRVTSSYAPVMESTRVALIREAYDRFNAADVGGLVALLDPDVEIPDVLNGTILRGAEAARRYWEREFELVEASITISEVVEVGDAILVVVSQEMTDRQTGLPLGQGVLAVHRLTFREGRIASIEYTGVDDVPQMVRERLG